MSDKVKERQMIFTTKLVDEATDRINDGVSLKRYENPWLKSEVGLKRSGIAFKMTSDEQSDQARRRGNTLQGHAVFTKPRHAQYLFSCHHGLHHPQAQRH